MLNPSTADAEKDDNTLRRIIRYTRDWGYGGLVVSNLFPYIATHPRDLKAAGADATTPFYGALQGFAATQSALIMAGWGSHRTDKDVVRRFKEAIGHRPLYCLKVTKDGQPIHPLRQRAHLEPIPYQHKTPWDRRLVVGGTREPK